MKRRKRRILETAIVLAGLASAVPAATLAAGDSDRAASARRYSVDREAMLARRGSPRPASATPALGPPAGPPRLGAPAPLFRAGHGEGGADSLALERGRPLALASGDFDGDGVLDLVCGFREGVVVVHRGNPDALFPHSPAARRRRAEGAPDAGPFHSPGRAFETRTAPELLATGDFDADGRSDVVVAAVGATDLVLLPGDGGGGLGDERRIDLPGRVTAMVASATRGRDGSAYLAVAVQAPEGPLLLVFEGSAGALGGAPETLALPEPARSLALGRLDDDAWVDLVAGTPEGLLIVHGRARRASADDTRDGNRGALRVDRLDGLGETAGVVVGDFLSDPDGRREVAQLSRNGVLRVLARRAAFADAPETGWETVRALRVAPRGRSRGGGSLLRARMSGHPEDDIVVVDTAGRSLRVLTGRAPESGSADAAALAELAGRPVAALPMRLGPEALSTLVVAQQDASPPLATLAATAAATIVVDSDSDLALQGDGSCTLREAIRNANANADTTAGDCAAGSAADTITFDVAGGGSTATIALAGRLPDIDDPATIDGTTQGCASPPCVELDGSSLGVGSGLALFAGSSTVRGFVIHSFPFSGIDIDSSGNIVEGNFIGTDITGTLARPNDEVGVAVGLTGLGVDNTLGGTAAPARNVISGNTQEGVAIFAADSVVQGNYIGTDASGTSALGNLSHGLFIGDADGNTIGGAAPGAGNVISSNGLQPDTGVGVLVLDGASGNVIQGNLIGTDVTGTIDLGNLLEGIQIQESSATTVGGAASGAGNVIAGNDSFGIVVVDFDPTQTAFDNVIRGNLVGTDAAGTADLGNSNDGVLVQDARDNTIEGNVVSGNNGGGIRILGFNLPAGSARQNRVEGNRIGTDAAGNPGLGNLGAGVLIRDAVDNTVGGTDGSAANVIASNGSDGVVVRELTPLPTTGNAILGNSVFDNGGEGIDLADDGVTPNDLGDPDAGANRLQNFPVLTSAEFDVSSTTVAGTLNSVAGTSFRIELFSDGSCDPSGHGEGREFLASEDVTTDAGGNVGFSVDVPVALSEGDAVTATATDPDGNTSEFSACVLAEDCGLQVFGQAVETSADKARLEWPVPQDVRWVKGPLSGVGAYAVSEDGSLSAATSLDISTDAPLPGEGFYYLVRLLDCGSWQTSLGAEPGRDASLP